MKILLTHQEKLTLESRHRKCSDKRECDRIKAILLSAEGWSTTMISQALRNHQTSIIRHLNDYISNKKHTSENGGSDSYLNEVQTEVAIAHLSDITYFHMHDIRDYIKDTFDVEYSISGLQKWLHRNGFSYKQLKGVPHKYEQEKQDVFVAEYEVLKATVASDEPILFMDATHPTQATKVSNAWIQTGRDKPIETTGSRTRLNIVGVGYHRSKVVKSKAIELGIELHYLPPYSPNLNPIERLWKVMNKNARNNKYFSSAKEFRLSIDTFFDETLPNIGNTLNGRINDKFQTFDFSS